MVKISLFDLIKTMSISKKRYFKLHSLKHVIRDKNQYTLLLNANEKQDIYNEKKLETISFVKSLSAE